jgi:hypothetical protein
VAGDEGVTPVCCGLRTSTAATSPCDAFRWCAFSPGIPIIFKGGQVYMLGNKSLKTLPLWIKRELLVYSHAMVHLSAKYQKQIPDTELVIYSDDVPGMAANRDFTRAPGFRMCRTDGHPDILIPIWHL